MNDTWAKLEATKRFSKWATWCAVVLAFIAGAAGVVEAITGATNASSIALACLSGIAGLSALVADKRKQTLDNAHKRTKPELNVAIKTHDPTGQFLVVIEPQNKIPFKYDWKIVTRNNLVVSGIHLEWGKILPSDKTPIFTERANFDVSRVVDDYIELRFDYRSIYANELPDSDLSGKLIRAYKLTRDRRFCIPTD